MHKKLLSAVFFSVIIFSCREKETAVDHTDWKAKGDSLVSKTFDTLRNTLLKAVGEKGFPGAVEFCNTRALDLTNTYTAEGISIERTSEKLRNPANAPDTMETRILAAYRKLKNENQELKSIVEKDAGGNHHFFKPILLQAICLNCHGERLTQIKTDTWNSILLKYPDDAAFDYKEGDLRGIWHITFSHSKKQY